MKRNYFKNKPRKPLKRSDFKIKPNSSLKRSGFKAIRKKLRYRGISDNSVLREQIQAILREIGIIRDGGCFLRFYPEAGKCGWRRKDGEIILQYEHLNSRTHAISFSDSRLGICICARHHIYWKPQNSARYNELAEEFIGPERTELWKRVRNDHRPYKVDLKLELVALKQELERLKLSTDESLQKL